MFKFSTSDKMFARSRKALAGGVGCPVRAMVLPHPVFFSHGKGSKIYDVDGNEYIDYHLGLGPLILGHCHPSLVKAAKEQLDKAVMFGDNHPLEYELSEKLVEIIPCADLVRYNSSGSEAVHATLRLARAYTGKNIVVKFEGHYHGWFDNIYVSHLPDSLYLVGLENAPRKTLGSPGQPESVLQDLIVLPWNNLEIVQKTLRERKHEIAAVITEPLMSNCGVIMPAKGYLEGLRQITQETGALLIFDEVITGFRLALGGAQEYFSVVPDLAVYSKGISGGFSLSCFGGRKDIMDLITQRKVVHAGCYNNNCLAMAGALATVTELAKDNGAAFKHINRLGKRLKEGLKKIIQKTKIQAIIQGPDPFFAVTFTSRDKITNFRESLDTHHEVYPVFRRMLFERGIRIFPTEKGLWYISAAHSDEDIDRTLEVAQEVLTEIARK